MQILRNYAVAIVEFAIGLTIALIGLFASPDSSPAVLPVSMLTGGVILCVSAMALTINLLAVRENLHRELKEAVRDVAAVAEARATALVPGRLKIFGDTYHRLLRELADLAKSVITISDESTIYETDRDLIRELPKGGSLRATFIAAAGNPQFKFPTFFASINEQVGACREKQVSIKRLYVFGSEAEYHENEELRDHMTDLFRKGIEVRYTWERYRVPIEDCVVFGDKAVAYGMIMDRPGHPQRMPSTSLLFDPKEVERGTRHFDDIWELATPLTIPDDVQHEDVSLELRKIIQRIGQEIPLEDFDTSEAALFDTDHSAVWKGKPAGRAIVELRSSGCEWALTSGGCTMCGEQAVTTRGKTVSPDEQVRQLARVLEDRSFAQHPILCIYNSGSFFNESELPPHVRDRMIGLVAKTKGIEKLILETRPEYLTPQAVEDVAKLLEGKTLEIAVGLETKSDEIRELCVNKNFTLQQFREHVEEICRLVPVLIYVLIKPPFLTEQEGIDDAIATARFALEELGASAVSFEPLSKQRHTLVERLCDRHLWRLPWLWSVVEVIQGAHSIAEGTGGEIRIGGYEYLPRPVQTAYNGEGYQECKHGCNEAIREAISHYNTSGDLDALHEIPDCGCKVAWRESLDVELPPLRKRIGGLLGRLR
jgi:radical SAM enzyme (TIGR01210 family)